MASIHSKWEAPTTGHVKINIDAGCLVNESACRGMLVKDFEGRVTIPFIRREHVKVSHLLDEALTLYCTMVWVKDQNIWKKKFIEVNVEQVVKCHQNLSNIAKYTL